MTFDDSGKDDLLDAVLDIVLNGIVLPPADGAVRADLTAGFAGYRRALIAHREIVRVMTERSRMSGAQVRLIERSLELLERAGLTFEAAVEAEVTLVSYVIGFVWREVGRAAAPPPELLEAPRTQRALSMVAARDAESRFLVGLGLILDRVLT